ncbi:cell filamentation protein Fic, partial [Candidatus Gracilibacteria bacterium]
IVNSKEVQILLKVTPRTANTFLALFLEKGILEEISGGERNKMYSFEEYFELFR